MTGFGEAAGPTAAGRLRVELRSVNHRYLNVNARLPSSLNRLEGEIKEWLRGSLTRGHVNCTLHWEVDGENAAVRAYRLDEARVANYLAIFRTLGEKFGVEGVPDLALLTRFGDIIVRSDEDESPVDVPAAEVQAVVAAAAEQLVRMREEEGKRLEADLRQRIAAIEVALGGIAIRAPERLIAERLRLTSAITELVDGIAVDQGRIAQEIAFLAERWDINEELVRFRSHDELFIGLLDAPPEEAVGKRLAFLVQEMHREANTIGSKANDAEIAHLVVGIKEEIDRLREQVENVE